jgi:DNA polymerase-1
MTARVGPALALVDGHNLLWRAAFGFPAVIRSRDGADRTATFAFFALLRAGLAALGQPAECIVCFDGEHGATRRQRADHGYKRNRDGADLRPLLALPDVQRGLSALGVRWIELDDEEADDVIASLVRLDPARPTRIISTDRDYLQLVSDQVRLLVTAGRGGLRLLGPAEVLGRYGVAPRQWCDFRALVGDPADHIPGVCGIGVKTAAKLLADGATLETLHASGRLVGAGRLGQTIRDQWERLLGWRELVRLRDQVPLPCTPSGTATPGLPAPRAVLEELNLW